MQILSYFYIRNLLTWMENDFNGEIIKSWILSVFMNIYFDKRNGYNNLYNKINACISVIAVVMMDHS